jgi:hypothetical protein
VCGSAAKVAARVIGCEDEEDAIPAASVDGGPTPREYVMGKGNKTQKREVKKPKKDKKAKAVKK